MSTPENLKRLIELVSGFDTSKRRNNALTEIAKNELLLALESGKDEQIESARNKVVAASTASIDEWIRTYREVQKFEAEIKNATTD
jgi:hypothetical protein